MTLDSKKLLPVTGFITLLCIAAFLAIQAWALPIVLIVVMIFLILVNHKPKIAVLVILAAKPLIDATWAYKLPFVGLNFLQITGVAFPIIMFLIIYSNRLHFRNYKAVKIYGVFVVINCIAYLTSSFENAESLSEGLILLVNGSGVLFQFLNSFTAYLIMPYLFETKKDRKQLFWILILAGIFPALSGLLQLGGIITGRTLRTTGELMRISGFYHDSTNMRMYSFQTLLATYVYLTAYVEPKDRFAILRKAICYSLIPISLLIIYKGYSKASIGILLSWILIYFVFQRKIFTGTVFLALLGVTYVFSDTVSGETEKLLYKEIKYAEGTLPGELEYTLLGGRFVYWGNALDQFAKENLASQIMGFNYVGAAGTHNEYIRILIASGILGLFTFIILLLVFAVSLLRNYVIHRDSLSLGAFMLFVGFLIDGIGLVPLLYPGYCWVVFGIISISLNRDAFKTEHNNIDDAYGFHHHVKSIR